MFCAISGEPPKVPLVSKKSGLVYEQRLIHKYINDNGKDPVTGDTLELDDLIEIKSSKFHIQHTASNTGRATQQDAKAGKRFEG